jgi:methionyl-tRNA formyltransferase
MNPSTRLISFCSSAIVPKAHLAAIPCGSYNFHPGPPPYPGRYPSVFALYEGVGNFGVTFHEMAERVDEGPIIATEWFTVPGNCDLETLDTMAFNTLLEMFLRFSQRLATDARPLKQKPINWSGVKRAKSDCDALCKIDPAMSQEEKALRIRACGIHIRAQN